MVPMYKQLLLFIHSLKGFVSSTAFVFSLNSAKDSFPTDNSFVLLNSLKALGNLLTGKMALKRILLKSKLTRLTNNVTEMLIMLNLISS